MLLIFLTVLPVFGVIFAGWAARRWQILGPQATVELNRFVVMLALPAMMFDVTATAKPGQLWHPNLIATFVIATLLVFAVTVGMRARGSRHLADAAVDGLATSYPNAAYMGFPIALAVFGRDALPLVVTVSLIPVCLVFSLAIVLIEAGLHGGRPGMAMVRLVTRRVLTNPIVVAPLLGMLVPISGLALPAPLQGFLALLSAAASPCALVALGLFLADDAPPSDSHTRKTVGLFVAAKLLAMPALTWLIGTYAFDLSKLQLHSAVLIAAMPTGTGPFMLAAFYGREAALTARTVLVSTVISLATLTLYLGMVGQTLPG